MKAIKIVLIAGLIALAAIFPATAAGQGYGNNNRLGQNLVFPEPENYNLTSIEVQELQYMREEQMAHDLYTVWSGMYSLPIFGNIAQVPLFATDGSMGILSGAALIFFAYTGFARVTIMAEEVQGPKITIPVPFILRSESLP